MVSVSLMREKKAKNNSIHEFGLKRLQTEDMITWVV